LGHILPAERLPLEERETERRELLLPDEERVIEEELLDIEFILLEEERATGAEAWLWELLCP
jgi:hypothetical protein